MHHMMVPIKGICEGFQSRPLLGIQKYSFKPDIGGLESKSPRLAAEESSGGGGQSFANLA